MCILSYGLALTAHLGMIDTYNSVHPFVECQHNNLVTSVYYNSVEDTTLYFGYRKQFENNWGYDIGLATGYIEEYPVPTGRITYKNFFILPGVEYYDDAYQVGIVAGIQIKLN